METRRFVLAIVLSIIVMVLYQMVFMKNKPQPEPSVQPAAPVQVEVPGKIVDQAGETVAKEPPAVAPPLEGIQAQAETQVIVDTPLYRAIWSNSGGSLRSWKLKAHRGNGEEELEVVSPRAAESGKYPFFLQTDDAELDRALNVALFRVSPLRLELREGETGELKFDYSDGNTIKAGKTFVFTGGSYDFAVKVDLYQGGRKIEPRVIWGPGIGEPAVVAKGQQFGGGSGVAVLTANRVYRVNERKYKPEASAFNFVGWAAYEENYMTALFLTPAQKGTALFQREEKDTTAFFFLSVSSPERAYLGPKEFDRLRAFGHGAQKVVNFGFFGGIAEVLYFAIKFIHRSVPNWGFSIIILTLLIKILFFPLTYSSTKSMARMQEIQPKIKALRARYKKAKQDIGQRRQMNEEMMKLYKEHGINPAGGCLPMLIQIPVFWGFFRLLVVAIEFRRSPFLLWIKDLSVKDPYYVTPILMGVTQFISQKMTPTTADPAQARMMLIMPVLMTFFFMNFQSGLVLYWLTNNVLQIGQQYIMNRMMAKKKRESHGKRK
jgi:YidC/Oxa1 family membrane protein insertase